MTDPWAVMAAARECQDTAERLQEQAAIAHQVGAALQQSIDEEYEERP